MMPPLLPPDDEELEDDDDELDDDEPDDDDELDDEEELDEEEVDEPDEEFIGVALESPPPQPASSTAEITRLASAPDADMERVVITSSPLMLADARAAQCTPRSSPFGPVVLHNQTFATTDSSPHADPRGEMNRQLAPSVTAYR
jgi:hypothetical protein